jgi:hypothetical protein
MVPNGRAIGRKIAVGDTTKIKLLLLYVPVSKRSEACQGIRPPPKLSAYN